MSGGMLPLSATLATADVFKVFTGGSKLDALLHGHSYAGNAIGCAVGAEALDILSDPACNTFLKFALQAPAAAAAVSDLDAATPAEKGGLGAGKLVNMWDADTVRQLSHHPRVVRVVSLGVSRAFQQPSMTQWLATELELHSVFMLSSHVLYCIIWWYPCTHRRLPVLQSVLSQAGMWTMHEEGSITRSMVAHMLSGMGNPPYFVRCC